MTHTTETKRPLVPRWRSPEFCDAMQPMGIPSALKVNGIEGRAFSEEEDS